MAYWTGQIRTVSLLFRARSNRFLGSQALHGALPKRKTRPGVSSAYRVERDAHAVHAASVKVDRQEREDALLRAGGYDGKDVIAEVGCRGGGVGV